MARKKAARREYLFRVMMEGIDKRKLWREIAVPENMSLYKLAQAILDAFDFAFDHCFGFYSNTKGEYYHDSDRQYEYFVDLIEEGEDIMDCPDALGTKKTPISDVWKELKDEMTFLFDYGDGWRFLVRLKAINEYQNKKKYPILVAEKGKAPEQYPALEEDDVENDLRMEDDELGDESDSVFSSATFVSTGLGWKDGKLRYHTVVNTRDRRALSSGEKKQLETILEKVAKKHSGEIGEICFGKEHVLSEVALPPSVAVGNFIGSVFIESDKKDVALSESFLVTNTRKPSDEEIEAYLRGETPHGFST